MDFNEYQKRTNDTAEYPQVGDFTVYPVLGLVSEAGEVAGKVKKIWRDKYGLVDTETIEDIGDELGDCVWYIAQICEQLGLRLGDVAGRNLAKLEKRAERGVIKGEGDKR